MLAILLFTSFFLFFNVILLFIERISSLYRGYQGEKLHKLKEKNLFSYMTLKNNNFSIFFLVSPPPPPPYNSKNKGERQKWISDSDSTSKNTSIKREKHLFFI